MREPSRSEDSPAEEKTSQKKRREPSKIVEKPAEESRVKKSPVGAEEEVKSGIMNSNEPFFVGQHCFAHVKGFPWWPAVIVRIKEKKTRKSPGSCFQFYSMGPMRLQFYLQRN